MNDYGTLMEAGKIRFVRLLPGPIERVWSYIAEPEKRAQWLAGGTTPTTPGEKIQLQFDNAGLTPHHDPAPEKYKDMEAGASYEGEMVEFNPPTLMRFIWPEENNERTEVTFRLTERGEQIEFEIIHERIPTDEHLIGASAGWHTHVDILAAKLSARIPEPFWATHEVLEAEYKKRFQK